MITGTLSFNFEADWSDYSNASQCVLFYREQTMARGLDDDAHCRKRDMRFLLLPTWFPRPESMEQGDTKVCINWIREETEAIMNQLEEERDARSDPDDLFNDTVNGLFLPLQDPLSLPPLVQMPKRNEKQQRT